MKRSFSQALSPDGLRAFVFRGHAWLQGTLFLLTRYKCKFIESLPEFGFDMGKENHPTI